MWVTRGTIARSIRGAGEGRTKSRDRQKFPLRKGGSATGAGLFRNAGRPSGKDNVSRDTMPRGAAFLNRKTTPRRLCDRRRYAATPFD